MESRKLIVNGQSIILSSEVINELHRQERIEEGKYMMEIFSSTDTFGKMTDDDFEEIVLSFEEMLNTDTNELMAEAVQNISEQVEKTISPTARKNKCAERIVEAMSNR